MRRPWAAQRGADGQMGAAAMTYEEQRILFDVFAETIEEWQGVPVPLPELPIILHNRHPMQQAYRKIQQELDGGFEIEIHVGGPGHEPVVAGGPDEEEHIRNVFHSRREQATIFIYERGGTVFHAKLFDSPDHSMNRLKFWLTTIGASDAWDHQAELKARKKLREMVSERQYRHYDLTGAFMELSERSGLTYVFRRLRPTIAMSPRHKEGGIAESMRCIACLCMHPIGYYGGSWGGCLVPTDDVIAHLISMRGDEAKWWGQCNQHEPWRPEAGI